MTFGQPLVLFPALGTVLLGGGAVTTGILTAAVAVGTFASSLFSGRVVQYRWHGRGIERAVEAYGASILAFGVVLLIGAFSDPATERIPNVALIVAACIALALSGASDNVSSIYRNTMMQAAVPTPCAGGCRACSSSSSPADHGSAHCTRNTRVDHDAVAPASARRIPGDRPRRAARATQLPIPGLRRREPRALRARGSRDQKLISPAAAHPAGRG